MTARQSETREQREETRWVLEILAAAIDGRGRAREGIRRYFVLVAIEDIVAVEGVPVFDDEELLHRA